MKTKKKKLSTDKKLVKTSKKGKAAKKAEREAKRAARKGDGSFPDILVVTKEKDKNDGSSWFLGHSEDMATIYKNDQTVAVYKLRRVSKVVINRKIAR